MATTQKKRNALVTIRDKWIEGLIFLLCVVVGVLGFFGVLDGIPFFNGKIPSITLILLAILTGYVAFTQHDKQELFQENISDGFRSIFERLDNSSTVVLRAHPFTNIDAALEHTRKQITLAKQQVLVVYPDLNPDFHRAVPTTVFYKQIFTVEPEKITKYQSILSQHLPRMPRNFSYACLRLPKELLQCFVIIDEKELIILSDLLPISTRNLQFIKVYRQSFNNYLDQAIKLKANDRLFNDRIEFILMPSPKVSDVPPELEDCIRNCLKAHEKLKKLAQNNHA